MENQNAVITVSANGEVTVGPGYNIGQVLEAIEIARRAILGIVLRPAPEATPS